MTSPSTYEWSACVCTACGLTCDDLVVQVDAESIVAVDNGCAICRKRLLGARALAGASYLLGRDCKLDDACVAVVEQLSKAKRPLIAGLHDVTTATLRAALEVADCCGAAIDWTTCDADAASTYALQSTGAVTATWGEVAQRADTVVYWGCDPVASGSSIGELHTELPRSRWLSGGRADRHIVVIDDRANQTAASAESAISINPESDYEVLTILRALVQNRSLDAERVYAATGIALAELIELVGQMRTARFGVVIVGKRLAGQGAETLAALTQLLADLTTETRWVVLDEGSPGNRTGAGNVLTWQAGAPLAVDFAQGVPHYRPREATALQLIEQSETDLLMLIAIDGAELLQAAANKLGVPIILLSGEMIEPNTAAVAIGVTRPGIDESGTTYRNDGVGLPLRALLVAHRPTAAAALQQIGRLLVALTAT